MYSKYSINMAVIIFNKLLRVMGLEKRERKKHRTPMLITTIFFHKCFDILLLGPSHLD